MSLESCSFSLADVFHSSRSSPSCELQILTAQRRCQAAMPCSQLCCLNVCGLHHTTSFLHASASLPVKWGQCWQLNKNFCKWQMHSKYYVFYSVEVYFSWCHTEHFMNTNNIFSKCLVKEQTLFLNPFHIIHLKQSYPLVCWWLLT